MSRLSLYTPVITVEIVQFAQARSCACLSPGMLLTIYLYLEDAASGIIEDRPGGLNCH